MTHAIAINENPEKEEVDELIRCLVAYNDEKSTREEHRRLGGFVRENGELVGGISGYTTWNWLFVGHLWVAESKRGAGLGSRLLESIESAAIERDCTYAWLDTFSFQAPEFYRSHGYEEFALLEDFPPGFSRTFFRKALTR